MTREDKGHFSAKHPAERKLNPDVARAVKARVEERGLPCPAAFEIAAELGVPAEEVGFTADRLEISLIFCQLGLHGYLPESKCLKPAESVSSELESVIQERTVDGRLPCRAAWDIAAEQGMEKMDVAAACELLEVKIISCQLGAFP